MFATLNKPSDQQIHSNIRKGGCKKCQNLYSLLNNHVLNDHGTMTGSNGILNNILLNILSLMIETPIPPHSIPSTMMTTNIIERQTVPMPVISKTNDQISKMELVENENSTQPESFPSSSRSQTTFTIPALSGEFSANQGTDLTSKLAFQPDLLTNLFTSTTNTSKSDFPTTSSRSAEIQNKMLQIPNVANLEIPFMLQTGASDATNLIGADGNLTAAGISLLLANQHKTEGSGKSDLDVADILVNKMPIPSLNKGFDSSLLQTLYLQQLAQGHLSIPLPITNPISVTPVSSTLTNMTTDLNNLMKSMNTSLMSSPEQINKQSGIGKGADPSNQSVSLQQLIQKHKQISELIEAMSNKQKNKEMSSQKTNLYIPPTVVASPESSTQPTQIYTTAIQTKVGPDGASILEPSIKSSNASKTYSFPLLQVPQIVRKSSSIPSTLFGVSELPKTVISKHHVTGKLVIDADGDEVSGNHRQPTVSEHYSSENLLNFFKSHSSHHGPKTSTIEHNNVQFLRQKSDIIPASLIQKGILGSLVINTDISRLGGLADSERDSESSRKRRYSSVTMVPISEYNPLDPNNEPLPTRVPSPSSKPKVLYKCEICGVTFSVLATLESHLKSHVTTKTEQCSYCHLSFTDQQKYFEHLTSHRGEENVFRCHFCPKIFTSKGDFNKHLTKHTQKRPYSCSHCHKAFKDPGSLTKHERIHTGEQPYVCVECNRGFAEKSSLRKHLRVHSGEKPYKCDECEKSFSISGNLQRHMYIHTGVKPFKCTQCSKAFNNPSHLRRHVKNLHQNVKSDISGLQKIRNVGIPLRKDNS